jgi:hypothetical protein
LGAYQDALGSSQSFRDRRHQHEYPQSDVQALAALDKTTKPTNDIEVETPHRCLVPATSFSEYMAVANPASLKIRMARNILWPARRTWCGSPSMHPGPPLLSRGSGRCGKANEARSPKPIEGKHPVYACLTCEPNNIVKPVNPDAMPAVLTTPEDWDAWMRAMERSERAPEAIAGETQWGRLRGDTGRKVSLLGLAAQDRHDGGGVEERQTSPHISSVKAFRRLGSPSFGKSAH